MSGLRWHFYVQRPLVFPFLSGSGVCVRLCLSECLCECGVYVGISVVSTSPGMLTQEQWTWSHPMYRAFFCIKKNYSFNKCIIFVHRLGSLAVSLGFFQHREGGVNTKSPKLCPWKQGPLDY